MTRPNRTPRNARRGHGPASGAARGSALAAAANSKAPDAAGPPAVTGAPGGATPPQTTPPDVVLLRPHDPPSGDHDLRDKHLTRATSDGPTLDRYEHYERHETEQQRHRIQCETEQEWHRIAQRLVLAVGLVALAVFSIVVVAAVFVTSVIALRRFTPEFSLKEDLTIVGAAVSAAVTGSGFWLRSLLRDGRYSRWSGADPARTRRPFRRRSDDRR